jgi:transposase InsO family protein
VWSYDFMGGRTRDGSPLRILNVVDEYTRLALGCHVDRSIGARDVQAQLEQLFARHGRPRVLRSDNGREFIAASLGAWLDAQGVARAFIEKGSPQQNAFVERFNGMSGPPLSGPGCLWVLPTLRARLEVGDAREALQRGADRGEAAGDGAAAGAGFDDPAGVQADRGFGSDVLPVAAEVRGVEGG